MLDLYERPWNLWKLSNSLSLDFHGKDGMCSHNSRLCFIYRHLSAFLPPEHVGFLAPSHISLSNSP